MKIVYLIATSSLAVFLFLTACNSSQKAASTGKELFLNNCASCHMSNGKGIGKLVPSLVESEKINTHREQLACMIRHGIENEDYPMLPNPDLSEIEITNILNFIRKEWHADEEIYTVKEIKINLANCNN